MPKQFFSFTLLGLIEEDTRVLVYLRLLAIQRDSQSSLIDMSSYAEWDNIHLKCIVVRLSRVHTHWKTWRTWSCRGTLKIPKQ